ncbi:hypothetical protein SAMN05216259_110142 [Actinacidiphila guanduensis]|uniref:Uncharacterized protein n=2 Tax=Actinacidiphila guanduensis TaxID=310781 RepID=A0A1H0K7V8_9ACTN|nr:hypothetical protein SAMN05216259_110142 [Actinacidiphila guanduensis]
MPVVRRQDGRGIGYADERGFDRDGYGVLWSRAPSQPGKGRPRFGQVHSLRQRIAMSGVRCQICGGPADRTRDGVLWLVDARPDHLRPRDEKTAHPPVCRPCAHRSVTACPHLRRAVTALRVRHFAPVGVNGILHRPAGRAAPEPVDVGWFAYDDPRIPWVRAHQLVVRLTGFAPVHLTTPEPRSPET